MKVDRAELEALANSVGKKRRCHVGTALAELEGEDLELLKLAVAEYSPGVVSEFVARRGYKVNISQATSHQRGTCVCHER